jgi:putative DNA primase/helicase
MIPQPDDVSYTRKLPALAELQARPQWVCWRKEQRGGKLTKVPYNPTSGSKAHSDNPATWASYTQSVQAQRDRHYDGLGYVFARDYTGVDLDHCVQPDGSIDPWAMAYLDQLSSYAEYSPSQTGIHILVRGTVPCGIRRRVPGAPHPEAAVEMYCEKRYFTVTGHQVEGAPATIEECPALASLHAALSAPRPASPRQQEATFGEEVSTSDQALLEKAMSARNGVTFRALWQGDPSGYASQSEAELALCHLLAFWTGKDASRMERLFRLSGLYRREKWDRPARSGESYGQGTIRMAITHCSDVYKKEGGGKIIPFRHERAAAGEARDIPVPETEIEFVLECLRDGEEGDARLYAHLFGGQCIYDHTEKQWYEWQRHYWKADETKHALLMASNHLAGQYMQASAQLSEEAAQAEQRLDPDLLKRSRDQEDPRIKHYEWLKATTGSLIERAKALKTLRRAQAVLTYAQAYLSITSREWDTNPWLLGTREGVLDLKTGELRDGKPEEYIRTIIPTTWRGLLEPAPRFEQFLREIFADRSDAERDELIGFLQRALGYGITGHVGEHIFLMLYGEEGRNGKDTLMTRLQRVLGSAVGAVSNDVIIATGKFLTPGSATPHLCALQGRRIVWASETSKGARFDVGQVKFLTGGGDIPARQLYGRDYSFAPSHLLLLLTNNKPHADAQDSAFWDRLCPIIFTIRFVDHPAAPNERQKDRALGEALDTETSGILAWLVRGCLAWQREGLGIPASVLQARREYRGEEDTLGHFLSECCIQHAQFSIKAIRLYERYKEWTLDNGLKALNGNAFGQDMKKRFEQRRRNDGLVYSGIALRSDEEACSPPSESLHASENASQADSLASTEEVRVGSVPFFQKPPLYREENVQKESSKEMPALPTLPPPSSVDKAASQADAEACRHSDEHKEPTLTPEREEFVL